MSTTPKIDHAIRQPAIWPGHVRTVEQAGRIVGVLEQTTIDYGKGQEWRVLWRRTAGGFVAGGGPTYPDAERAAAACLAEPEPPALPAVVVEAAPEPPPVAKSVARTKKARAA